MAALDPLLLLLQLSDSALPIGAFSHSWGLETAIQAERLQTATQVSAYLQGILTTAIAPLEGRACVLAHRCGVSRQDRLFWQLHHRLSATRWAPEPRQASLALGHRLAQLSPQVWGIQCPEPMDPSTSPGPHHCLAFGWIAAQGGLGQRETVQAYLFSTITGLVSAVVRLVPLGHTQGQQILAQMQMPILEQVPRCLGSDPLAGFAPLQERDCQAHRQLYSRLFQS